MSVGVQVRMHKQDDFMEVDKYGAGTVVLKDVKLATDSDR
jgi:hypoxanthine-guanine phosphoribosyltransferase